MPARPRDDPSPSGGEPGPAVGPRRACLPVTSAGVADLAERQANGVAVLDRALEARLGELDRAFASRRTHLEGRLSEAEGSLAEAIDAGGRKFKRAASDERRLLREESAAQLAELERAVSRHLRGARGGGLAVQLSSLRCSIACTSSSRATAPIREFG